MPNSVRMPSMSYNHHSQKKLAHFVPQEAIIGIAVPNLSGGIATMMPNHHITKPVLIGEIQDDGQFDIVWETNGTVVGDAWSDFLPGSRDITADWMAPLSCGNYNVKSGTCSGQNYE